MFIWYLSFTVGRFLSFWALGFDAGPHDRYQGYGFISSPAFPEQDVFLLKTDLPGPGQPYLTGNWYPFHMKHHDIYILYFAIHITEYVIIYIYNIIYDMIRYDMFI